MSSMSVKQGPSAQEIREFNKAASELNNLTFLCGREIFIIQMSYSDIQFKGLKENEDEERLVMTITDGLSQMF